MKKILFSLVCICASTVLYGQWTTNVNDIYYSSGLVGIGTSSPSHTLQVTSSNNPTVSIGKLNTNTGGKSTLYFYAGNGSTSNGMALSYFKDSSSDRMSFIDGSLSEVFTIQNGGNVGIGETSPFAPLTIKKVSTAPMEGGVAMAFEGGGFSEIGYRFRANGSNYYQVLYNGSAINWKNWNGSSYDSKMTLTNSGLLGIGTTPNLVQLDIQQNTVYGIGLKTANRSFTMRVDGTSFILGDRSVHQDRLTVLGNGNVGIGTTTPSQKLHVNGSSRFDSWIAGNSSTGVLEIYGDQESSSGLIIRDSGKVGIGTTSPTELLSVNGNILTKKVRVSTASADWPDFVFAPEYGLRTLEEVESFINKNQHLPEVPSAKEVDKNGLDLGDMDATLLKKVEELTLYMIELNKTVKAQGEKIKALEKENEELKKKK